MGTVRSLLTDLRDVATRRAHRGHVATPSGRRRPRGGGRPAPRAVGVARTPPHRDRGSGRPPLQLDPARCPHPVPDPLPAGRVVGGGPPGSHRAPPAPLAPGPRPGGRRRVGVGARAPPRVPGARLRALGCLPGDLRPHGRAPLPHGAGHGGGGDGAGGLAAPGPPDPPHRRGARGPVGAVEPLPLAGLPHRSDRGHRARVGRGARGGVGVRHAGGTPRGGAGRGRARRARRRCDRRAGGTQPTRRPGGVRRRDHHRPGADRRPRARRGRRAAARARVALRRVPRRTANPRPQPARAGGVRGVSRVARARTWASPPHASWWPAPTARSRCSSSSRSPGPSSTTSVPPR